MHRLPVEELKEGMILAEPILDPVGRVLLGKGEALTRLYINKLERWGIYEVSVEGGELNKLESLINDNRPRDARDESNIVTRIEARLDKRFKDVGADNEYMGIIKALAKKHLVEQAQQESPEA